MHVNILSERAVVVSLDAQPDWAVLRQIGAWDRALRANPFPGWEDNVPAYISLTVHFEPLTVRAAWPHKDSPARAVVAYLQKILPQAEIADVEAPALHRIPVQYDGPDLPEAADRLRLSEADLIALHSGIEYIVCMIGFLPGFPYLGFLPPELELPRRDTPRLRVPAGSVAIAGRQTGIYPQVSPGGWHLIGRTEVILFEPGRPQPALLQAGDRVQFFAI